MEKTHIRTLRQKTGLSQELMAKRIGIALATYKRWEYGKTEPRASEIAKLCEVLGVSEAELLRGPQSKEWRIEVVFRKEEDWEMNTVDMSASAPNLFLVQVGLEKIGLNLVGDPKDEAELDGLWGKAKPQILKMIAMRRELNDGKEAGA